jgi:hypothetical protein
LISLFNDHLSALAVRLAGVKPRTIKDNCPTSDDAGRVISILIEVNNKLILNIINIYAPNQPRERM